MKHIIILLFCMSVIFFSGCEKQRHEIGKAIQKSLKKAADDAWFNSIKKRYKGEMRPENCYDDPKVIALCHAIIQEDVVKMEQLITDGADVHAIGKQGTPILLYAFPFGEKVLLCLLEHGAYPHNENKKVFDTVISYILTGNPRYKNYLEILLKYGANPESDEDFSPVLQAASCMPYHIFEPDHPFSWLVTLVEAGVDLNRDTAGYYAVTSAAKNRCYNNLLYLLESGASYDTQTIPGGELQRVLYNHYNEYKKNKKYLDDLQKNDKSMTKLVKAVNKGNEQLLKVIKWLEEHGVSFDKPVSPKESTKKPEPFRVVQPKWLNSEQSE